MRTRNHASDCLQNEAEEQGWVDKFGSTYCDCEERVKHDEFCTYAVLVLPQYCTQCLVIAKVRADERAKLSAGLTPQGN